jgi:hypothetical protein
MGAATWAAGAWWATELPTGTQQQARHAPFGQGHQVLAPLRTRCSSSLGRQRSVGWVSPVAAAQRKSIGAKQVCMREEHRRNTAHICSQRSEERRPLGLMVDLLVVSNLLHESTLLVLFPVKCRKPNDKEQRSDNDGDIPHGDISSSSSYSGINESTSVHPFQWRTSLQNRTSATDE